MNTCVPHQLSTWPVDADGHEANLCEVCGTPTRYGSRHVQCAPGWVEPTAQADDGDLPTPYAHIYPLDESLCAYPACFTPSTQPSTGPRHQPVFTEDQVRAYASTEIDLLREVHEAARQFLRFRGIDKERQDAALVRLVDATEAVKDFDATS